MERGFADYSFTRVGAIRPEHDSRGALIEERPESSRNLLLHRYGRGPFCRFRIAQEGRWRRSGVYVLTCGHGVRYVGTCKNLATIWNFVGRITRSAVRYEGGQQTHCRINSLILSEVKQEAEPVLWFRAVHDDRARRALKTLLVAALNPPWNLTSTVLPRSLPPTTRFQSQAQDQFVSASVVRPSRGEDVKGARIEGTFAGYSFKQVGPVLPERDDGGEVIAELPQSKFRNERKIPLHKYGRGPFCRFRIAKGWPRSGVYVLADGDDSLYVGECQDLESRWGLNGYGGISPRNCYTGGQETNCRINNLIYRETKAGARLHLWFHPVEGGKQARLAIESRLVASLRPPWNR